MKTLLMFALITSSSAFHGQTSLLSRKRAGSFLLKATDSAQSFWTAREDCWRPTVEDVERISWGKPAKKKRTGSRGVPHRLNQEERRLFDQSRRKGFLEVGGSAWRSQRRDAPLLNSYRSLCDAKRQANIVLHKGSTGIDELVIDLSPLRTPEEFTRVAGECAARVSVDAPPSLTQIDQVDEEDEALIVDENDSWENRPIYQLPPFCVSWELPRSEAKALGKELAALFNTVEKNAAKAKSRKPVGVKHGKGRRHGGYGIG